MGRYHYMFTGPEAITVLTIAHFSSWFLFCYYVEKNVS
uniref:Uncharacterized protein n=1 Tax=Heterorhabditis bacteriophora TaxID=37862 RepID=A0A1I7XFR6_HETBA